MTKTWWLKILDSRCSNANLPNFRLKSAIRLLCLLLFTLLTTPPFLQNYNKVHSWTATALFLWRIVSPISSIFVTKIYFLHFYGPWENRWFLCCFGINS